MDYEMKRLVWGKLSPRVKDKLLLAGKLDFYVSQLRNSPAYDILNQLGLIDAKCNLTELGKQVVSILK